MSGYVELHCHSAYSFLDGASQPEELAARAAELGYEALALTDHDGLYGSLEFAHAAKAFGVRPITGAEVTLSGAPKQDESGGAGFGDAGAGSDDSHVTLLVESKRGYGNLCRLLTAAHAGTRRPGKEGREPLPPSVSLETVAELSEGLVCLSGCARRGLSSTDPNAAARLSRAFGRERFFVELQRPYERGDTRRNAALRDLAEHLGVETVATGDVHAHHPRRTLLQDALVAIRCRTSLEGCEPERRGNREGFLRSPAEMLERFTSDRAAAERSAELARRLEFDLTEELGYQYPDFSDGQAPAIRQLAEICQRAVDERYVPSNRLLLGEARARLEDELRLIDELGLAGFFLLHHEVLELAREAALEVRGLDSPRQFLPPGRGRGSSVGSIVCYLTGLSHVDPAANDLSLGRFLNRELASAPDIDLDFPRDIREKLIVAVTERYGKEHAALVASFATYRSRGAIRDVGKALGLPYAELERLARLSDGWNARRVGEELEKLPDGQCKLGSKRWRAFAWLTGEIAGLPRHVSQHPGGMIVSTRPLIELVPVQPAAMAGRQLCQWDKDSCADAGFLKIDLLGLGMLSAVEDCVEQIARVHGEVIDLSRIPFDDTEVFADIQRADTVGAFQIESRAQMQSLLRTKPENLDDLTVQVALVRPGPIQGKAVHPYIDARERLRGDPSYVWPVDHELLREPLRSTYGVVVFQDQVLEVAIALAGFTVGEAEGLRRAMSRKRSHDALEAYRGRFVAGAAAKGVDPEIADSVFDKLVGFSGFGFPKAHAAAFGLLAYQSQWLRRHFAAEFLCALLNAQPMGFYPPATLVRDAQRRGVEVLPADVNLSAARCTIEECRARRTAGVRLQPDLVVGFAASETPQIRFEERQPHTVVRLKPDPIPAVRIGISYLTSVGSDDAEALVAERETNGPFRDIGDLARRATLSRDGLEALVKGGACDGFGRRRRDLLWELGLVLRPQSVPGTKGETKQLPLSLDPTAETPALRDLTRWERMLADYRHTGLSVGTHPLTLMRPHLPAGTLSSADLLEQPHGRSVAVAGMAIARQRPSTANGIVFMLLEDEYGQMNLIVQPHVYERHRATVRAEPLVLAYGRFEKVKENQNVLVSRIESLGPLARTVADSDAVWESLPRAHHFGHR
ncbi:MAG: error-prone DNA polymerase [Actinobacteria bacterium]|nr:error-prone DNA polymerase [Actinomycetota bacterium]